MNICEHLTISAKQFPDKVALVDAAQTFTYARLARLAAQAADRLKLAGVAPGDRVAIMLPNVPAFVVWYYAALRTGAIAVSISTRLSEQEVAFVVSDCEAKVFLANEQTLATYASQLPEGAIKLLAVSDDADRCGGEPLADRQSTDPDDWHDANPNDAALILYTSGTTGFAKGATLSHNNVRSNVLEFNRLCDMQSSDRLLLAVPLFHCFGQNALLNSALNVGATLVLQQGFDLNESKRLIAQQRVTQLYGVPTMFQLLHESCCVEDLRTVRYCFSAAAKLPVQLSRRWLEKFRQPIYEGYGLTETSPFASYNHGSHYLIGSIGSPIDGVEMKIVDSETGQPSRPGELGEIVIRGPNVMLGYWNRAEDTATAIRDGWFYSGDIGRRDEQGYFHIVDRVKDMIVVGGLKVYPAEVERVLLDHGAVAEAAVVGLPDEVFGEQVIAFVVLANQAEGDEDREATDILQHCRDNLASYKTPKQCVFIDALPRNPAGKILKRALRDFELPATGALSSGLTESQAAELGKLRRRSASPMREPTLWSNLRGAYATNRISVATSFIQELVQILSGEEDRLEPETRFLEAGLDSLLIVEISSQIQAEVGTTKDIPATLVFDYPTVRDLAQFLVQTFDAAEGNEPAVSHDRAPDRARAITSRSALRQHVDTLTEEEAIDELMRELEGS